MKKRFKMVAGLTLSLSLLLPAVCPAVTGASAGSFQDAKGHWASDAVETWAQRGIINGYGDGSLKPDGSITIAEFTAVINRLFGFDNLSEVAYSDVSRDDWYAEDLAIARMAGYYQGSGNKANPNAALTGNDAAAMLAGLFQRSKAELAVMIQNAASTNATRTAEITRAELLVVLKDLVTHYGDKWFETADGKIRYVFNRGGPTLGYSVDSGVKILTDNGYAFKDLNKNGKLDTYEDWRKDVDGRAKNLASLMSIEQIAGLMLYSSHQSVPGGTFGGSMYNGKPYKESGAKPWDLSDDQVKFLTQGNLRHVLITTVESPEVSARWSNNVQALVEAEGLGIPANNSTDPRHTTVASTEYNAGAGGKISMWPETLGLAASFDPKLTERFGQVASQEYRGLGIATALSPQIDLATEPRWSRYNGTFGEDSKLTTDMARAYVDGFQTSTGKNEIEDGWGYTSVNAMVKHWPGGGSGEGGRDAHFSYGKYAVYPGNNFEEHLLPFTEGAFKLNGKTEKAAAVMPYYTISYKQDTVNGENVGNSYNKYLITDLLRNKYGYDGVVTTDWGITGEDGPTVDTFSGKPWGVEEISVAERHYKVIMSGVDQFGGNNDSKPVIEAYNMGVKEYGEAFMRQRFEQSAVRLLRNILQVGLFENPYLNVEQSVETVGNPGFMAEGYEAQLKSIVMLKNKAQALPIAKKATVYVPKKFYPETVNWFGIKTPSRTDYPISLDIVKKYYNVTDNPAEADFALVVIDQPAAGTGYSRDDLAAGGNGYVPISLQYDPYTAVKARSTSIAGGDPLEAFTNRAYANKTVTTSNVKDKDTVLETKQAMNGKPVIVSVMTKNPFVVKEFEGSADAILLNFGVQDQAILDIVSGAAEPSALLPMQMPKDMDAVETQLEDVPHDMAVHVDSEGNAYDFGFGLNWKGVIKDERTAKYVKK